MDVLDRVDDEWMCEYDVLESMKCDMRAKKQKHGKKNISLGPSGSSRKNRAGSTIFIIRW